MEREAQERRVAGSLRGEIAPEKNRLLHAECPAGSEIEASLRRGCARARMRPPLSRAPEREMRFEFSGFCADSYFAEERHRKLLEFLEIFDLACKTHPEHAWMPPLGEGTQTLKRHRKRRLRGEGRSKNARDGIDGLLRYRSEKVKRDVSRFRPYPFDIWNLLFKRADQLSEIVSKKSLEIHREKTSDFIHG